MDFDLSFSLKPVVPKKKLEFWVPLSEDPILSQNEIQSLWYGKDVVESLHIVKIAYLFMDDNGGVDYAASGDESEIYFLAAKLKKVPYIVIYDHYRASSEMKTFLVNQENPYYIDLFYSPNFGTFRPKYFLFQQASLSAIPSTMVLFREI